ncbi:hypothetical protein [Consotaella salsifontis]|uniref:Yip1 domain-containing protein n=1 Tax=Consotaella salsifontis TaxID=1365950 RepID=A0A1T4QJP6_9HYPH|nr:hypothetical protein [Consotaella salsifontis]SKA03857.1 hypothetical protein SAMN05428963_10583 [Consotaella salsifontis]
MPRLPEVLRYFSATARMMAGRPDGLKALDLSADGFWASFAALPISLPPLALSWIEYESAERTQVAVDAGLGTVLAAHFVADVLSWLLPVLILMMIARPIGFSRKIVPLVIATNWGGALLAWAMVPYWLLVMALGEGPTLGLLGIVATIASLTLTVRLAAVAIGGDILAAIGIVTLMVISSLVSYGAVMDVTGVPLI